MPNDTRASVFCLIIIATFLYVAILYSRSNYYRPGNTPRPYVTLVWLDSAKQEAAGQSNVTRTHVTRIGTLSQILYLTQTEKCLPDFLKDPELIGDTTACQCDVLVLSFKEECNDISLPHVKYIFKPSTTWSTGRNALYETAKASDKFYFYYIFMDDDVNLKPVKKIDRTPWRMFEYSLRVIQPAVAVVDPYLEYRSSKPPKYCEPGSVTHFAQVVGFDACFNAFHHQVVDHLLPYPTEYDNRSWWYSQIYISMRSDVKFHGDVVGDTRLRTINNQHRSYPREVNLNTVEDIPESIKKEVPKENLNISEPILQSWIPNPFWRESGDLYCTNMDPLKSANGSRVTYIPYGGHHN